MSFFRRPGKKLPCRFMLCQQDLIEQIEVDVRQWDPDCLEMGLPNQKVYVCRAHADMLERAAYAGYEIWLSREGWVYVVLPTSTLDWGPRAWVT